MASPDCFSLVTIKGVDCSIHPRGKYSLFLDFFEDKSSLSETLISSILLLPSCSASMANFFIEDKLEILIKTYEEAGRPGQSHMIKNSACLVGLFNASLLLAISFEMMVKRLILPKGQLIIGIVLDPSGYFLAPPTIQNDSNWVTALGSHKYKCAVYAYYGPFGSCGITSGLCNCLTGFSTRFYEYLENEKWNEVCVRKVALECEGGDEFSKHENIKLPDHAISFWKYEQYRLKRLCLRNCSCSAYAYSKKVVQYGLMIYWIL
ncbi:hypothetical protein HAX54_028960 [Datura stramonium]|uniref:Uncharacterized protein n=1 Tax=Datura stramonium TaxID=4076 RepID=A0ABS8S9Y1_DATST|nr:hypothetical protein [Datura stramonium]